MGQKQIIGLELLVISSFFMILLLLIILALLLIHKRIIDERDKIYSENQDEIRNEVTSLKKLIIESFIVKVTKKNKE